MDKGFRCKPEAQEPLRLGGVPAVLFIDETCRGWFYLHVVCTRGKAGFQAYWLSPLGTAAADRTAFERFLQTFSFTR